MGIDFLQVWRLVTCVGTSLQTCTRIQIKSSTISSIPINEMLIYRNSDVIQATRNVNTKKEMNERKAAKAITISLQKVFDPYRDREPPVGNIYS